ncbi:MAG TPA: PAS domain-containing protein [Dongiaceae bacterium]|nr:PAS domain-containing protein [Dongiaceae bacterium]
MSELRKSQTFAVLERPEQARTAKIRALFAYWQRLQQAERPTRASLDPAEMKPYLGNLLTGNIEPDPFRVLYKLVGTLIVEYSQCDFSNRYLDEMIYPGHDDVDWERCYRQVHAKRQPIVGECRLKGTAGRIIAAYEYAIFPLWRDDDPAGSFVAIEVYDGIDTNRIPDWIKVKLKSAKG